MNTYIDQIKAYLAQHELHGSESVLEILYYCHLEKSAVDEEEIEREFAKLDEVLDQLTLKEYDRVWDAACKLCSAHERRGFAAGARAGVRLMLELLETGQEEDSCFSQKETAESQKNF